MGYVGIAARAQSSALTWHWSEEVLGVVIVDGGKPSPEGDSLLLSLASAYRQDYRRQIVSVANTHTLEQAVRGCVDQGATKVMVVPFLCSPGYDGGHDLPMALADLQLKLPGVKCATGEAIPVTSILAQHIENQVKVVEVKAPDEAPERWWAAQLAANNARQSQSSSVAAVAARSSSQAPKAQQAQQAPPQQQQQQTARKQAGMNSSPQHSAQQASSGATQAKVAWGNVAPAAAAVWSDDAGAVVMDFREKAEPAAASAQAASSSTTATTSATTTVINGASITTDPDGAISLTLQPQPQPAPAPSASEAVLTQLRKDMDFIKANLDSMKQGLDQMAKESNARQQEAAWMPLSWKAMRSFLLATVAMVAVAAAMWPVLNQMVVGMVWPLMNYLQMLGM